MLLLPSLLIHCYVSFPAHTAISKVIGILSFFSCSFNCQQQSNFVTDLDQLQQPMNATLTHKYSMVYFILYKQTTRTSCKIKSLKYTLKTVTGKYLRSFFAHSMLDEKYFNSHFLKNFCWQFSFDYAVVLLTFLFFSHSVSFKRHNQTRRQFCWLFYCQRLLKYFSLDDSSWLHSKGNKKKNVREKKRKNISDILCVTLIFHDWPFYKSLALLKITKFKHRLEPK
jgi:hypothetical protein